LAGSSHFFGVLPILALPNSRQAVVYLAAFAAGTILSMASFSWVMGLLSTRRAGQSTKMYRVMMSACSVTAIVVGCVWLLG